jgi:hypothetical protein
MKWNDKRCLMLLVLGFPEGRSTKAQLVAQSQQYKVTFFRSHSLALHCGSAGVLLRALVPIKPVFYIVLSVYGSAERGHRNCELLPARCTHGSSGSAAKPLHNLIALFGIVIITDSRIGQTYSARS